MRGTTPAIRIWDRETRRATVMGIRNRSAVRTNRPLAVDSGHSRRLPAVRRREAERMAADLTEADPTEDRAPLRPAAATAAAIGIGRLRVRRVRSVHAAAARTPARAATGADRLPHLPRLPARSWICGSQSYGPLRATTADTRVRLARHMEATTAGLRARPARPMAVPVARLRATVDRRAMVDIAALRATAAREERQATAAAADTIQRRVAVEATTPVAVAADAPTEVVA